ncbi:MAG: MarR family transcriptional regulator [Actinomycetota bacterium]|nr:MarR family transcriptional regulator [Actinomycetota bacterium]
MLLSDQLCFALYAASRNVTAVYRVALEPLGLTYPQYLVMLVLWEHDGLLVGRIMQLLHLDYGTLTPLVKRLEASGLVLRRPADPPTRRPADERVVDVRLTPHGTTLREPARKVPGIIGKALGITPDQRDHLRDELLDVSANVTRHLLEG